MPLELTPTHALLQGHVDIEEAEPLLAWLVEDRDRPVDVSQCPSAHTAVLQVLLALRPTVDGAAGHQDWRALLNGPLDLSTDNPGETA